MRFICFAYFDGTKWNAMSETERSAFMEECFPYDDELWRGGHLLGGEALQDIRNTATLQIRNGQIAVTDGPYIETKEHLGGFIILEARDLNHAIALLSKYPSLRLGALEIRPSNEEIRAKWIEMWKEKKDKF